MKEKFRISRERIMIKKITKNTHNHNRRHHREKLRTKRQQLTFMSIE